MLRCVPLRALWTRCQFLYHYLFQYCVLMCCVSLFSVWYTVFFLYCTVFWCIVLCCPILFCTILCCVVFWCIILLYTVFWCVVFWCSVLWCTVLFYSVLCFDALFCTILCVLCCLVFYNTLDLKFSFYLINRQLPCYHGRYLGVGHGRGACTNPCYVCTLCRYLEC